MCAFLGSKTLVPVETAGVLSVAWQPCGAAELAAPFGGCPERSSIDAGINGGYPAPLRRNCVPHTLCQDAVVREYTRTQRVADTVPRRVVPALDIRDRSGVAV